MSKEEVKKASQKKEITSNSYPDSKKKEVTYSNPAVKKQLPTEYLSDSDDEIIEIRKPQKKEQSNTKYSNKNPLKLADESDSEEDVPAPLAQVENTQAPQIRQLQENAPQVSSQMEKQKQEPSRREPPKKIIVNDDSSSDEYGNWMD